MGLLLTLLLGVFIIVGALIVFITKNNNRFINFSISLAFGVILMLIITDLIPEAYEIVDNGNLVYSIVYILIGAGIGFLLLRILDHFIPDHDDDPDTEKDDEANLEHIGLVSSIALVIHNLVEGMAIYLLVTSDLKAGLMACVGVGLHNIPLGMVIASAFYKSNKSILKTSLIIFGISLSTFVGGLLIYFFNLGNILEVVEGISLTLTIGMLLYILTMELLPKVIHSKYKIDTVIAVVLGIVLLGITLFI